MKDLPLMTYLSFAGAAQSIVGAAFLSVVAAIADGVYDIRDRLDGMRERDKVSRGADAKLTQQIRREIDDVMKRS